MGEKGARDKVIKTKSGKGSGLVEGPGTLR